ncbi:non-heme iron oxygenase ferredoxin subunit [Streptomyces roseirectus]|uniref:Non-heme iron oxygenase ferredoxin subunit n=1 Tax=Streptomyces roseirectus TaxID=2768066 RepID=A0A7H0INP6_9ACTN|nr:non-heme iron oxygenase ferredoxin subunit [Streptomyces roseirectus]QNP74412.1 non-heme iron oxygenase ferredoxin subunit [Streptomyces roseirectus]
MPESGFIDLCALDVLEEDVPRRFEAAGVPLAVVRTASEVFAIHDICSHSAVSLSEGEVEGRSVSCWLHGSRFDLGTGKPLDPPATRPVPVYPVRVADGRVYVRVAGEF